MIIKLPPVSLIKAVVLLLCGALWTHETDAQTMVGFDSTSDLATYFNTVGNNSSVHVPNSTGGVLDSGSIAIGNYDNRSNQTSAIYKTGVAPVVGDSISVSIMQKTAATWNGSTPDASPAIWLNAANNTSLGFSGDFTAIGIQTTFGQPTSGIGWFGITYDAWNAGAQVGGANGELLFDTTCRPIPANWYKVTMTYSPLTGGSYRLAVTIDDYGINGSTFVSKVEDANITISTFSSFYSNSTLYPAFAGSGFSNATTLDNFTFATSTVPEPSTYAALGGTIVFVCALLHRRRKDRGG